MQAIYEPKGKAREYSPLGLNIYNGCDHGCKYCYVPTIQSTEKEVYHGHVSPRKYIIEKLLKDLKHSEIQEQVFLSFAGDPYCKLDDELALTGKALRMLNENGAPAAILSKGGSRMLKDIDIFKSFGKRIKVGATMVFLEENLAKEWEPGAASPQDRLDALRELHAQGIRTFISMEPTILPQESLDIIKASLDFVDEYKVGKINYSPEQEAAVKWEPFTMSALRLLRDAGKKLYIKKSLQSVCRAVSFKPHEIDFNHNTVKRGGE